MYAKNQNSKFPLALPGLLALAAGYVFALLTIRRKRRPHPLRGVSYEASDLQNKKRDAFASLFCFGADDGT